MPTAKGAAWARRIVARVGCWTRSFLLAMIGAREQAINGIVLLMVGEIAGLNRADHHQHRADPSPAHHADHREAMLMGTVPTPLKVPPTGLPYRPSPLPPKPIRLRAGQFDGADGQLLQPYAGDRAAGDRAAGAPHEFFSD